MLQRNSAAFVLDAAAGSGCHSLDRNPEPSGPIQKWHEDAPTAGTVAAAGTGCHSTVTVSVGGSNDEQNGEKISAIEASKRIPNEIRIR